jgi:hypothetical protein
MYLISQKWIEKVSRKHYKNHLRSNNYEVCTAVAHCFLNILDAIGLENINLSEDKIELTALLSNETELYFCRQLFIYGVSSVYMYSCSTLFSKYFRRYWP